MSQNDWTVHTAVAIADTSDPQTITFVEKFVHVGGPPAGNKEIFPFVVGQSVRVLDGALSETVTPTAVSSSVGSFTAVFTNPHSAGVVVTGQASSVALESASGQPAIDFSDLVPGSETYGSAITTKTAWPAFKTAGACGVKLMFENQCNTGEFATLRLRARAKNTTVSGNGGNSVGTVTCADLSASAYQHEYGNLRAVNACAQPNDKNQTVDATNIVTALYGRIDATGTSVGRRWVSWLDTHATTKAAGGDYMERISHNGTASIDGCWTIYNGGRLPLLFNFEDNAGFVVAAATAKAVDTNTQALNLAVKVNGTAYYIPLMAVA